VAFGVGQLITAGSQGLFIRIYAAGVQLDWGGRSGSTPVGATEGVSVEKPSRLLLQLSAFSVGLAVLIGASWLAASAAFALYQLLPPDTQRADWPGPVIDQLAPGLSGLLVSALLIYGLRRMGIYRAGLRAHFVRAVPWYGFAAWVFWVTYVNRANTDFGLWKQLIQWPLAATIAAVAYDFVTTVYLGRNHLHRSPTA
jgi:hypothetical protein